MMPVHLKKRDRISCPIHAETFKHFNLLYVIMTAVSSMQWSCHGQKTALHIPPPHLLALASFLLPFLHCPLSLGADQGYGSKISIVPSVGITELLGRHQQIHQRSIIEAYSGEIEPVPCRVKTKTTILWTFYINWQNRERRAGRLSCHKADCSQRKQAAYWSFSFV